MLAQLQSVTDAQSSDIAEKNLHLLHVGCGHSRRGSLPLFFQSAQWIEIRLDIDPHVQPDILGSITDLSAVADASVDAIWSSHNLEHINSFEVPIALAEFRRVLKPSGFVLITVPDLRAVARYVANNDLDETLYQSAAGPIAAMDIMFGHQASLASGHQYMAHRTGFSANLLGKVLLAAGFSEVRVHEGQRWDLWALATLSETDLSIFEELKGVLR
nr:methyltransferase domain-containing protein [uncultured Undibacterium sp.]